MWPYWFMFLVPAVLAINERSFRGGLPKARSRTGVDLAWVSISIVFSLLIGYRNNVGGDWAHYLKYLYIVQGLEVEDLFLMSDPAYHLINWVSVEAGWGIFGVNLFCGGVFASGLVGLCRVLPRPWLALAVSLPYMVIVVGMGYSRQAVALGFAMVGLVALLRKSTVLFVFWVFLGATFHKTAVLLLPVAALASSQNRYLTLVWVGGVTLAAYGLLLQESVDNLYSGYVEAGYQSEGALIRLMMNAVPAVVLLLWWKRFRLDSGEASLWRWFSIISILLLAVLFVSPSSTAVDRIALYMLPLQLVVFSHVPDVFGRRQGYCQELTLGVLLYYAAVLFVWLNYAVHARYWLPYRFYPLELL